MKRQKTPKVWNSKVKTKPERSQREHLTSRGWKIGIASDFWETTQNFLWKYPSKMKKYFPVQFSRSVTSESLRPQDCSTPGFPVCHQLPVQFSSVAQLYPTLQPREPQHTRPPCPSPTPGVHPNPCPLTRWCHPTISSSVIPFSSCPQSLQFFF